MKILSLNIWNGGTLWSEMLDFLRTENPDIILLQEVWRHDDPNIIERSLDGILTNLNYEFSAFAPAFRHNSDVFSGLEEGNLILSHFPLTEHSSKFYYGEYYTRTAESFDEFIKTPRVLQSATIALGDSTLHLFHTHGIWAPHGNDTPDRLVMAQFIIDAIDGKDHVVLGGDCNVLPETQTINTIEKYLTNVLKNDSPTTFNMKRKENPGYATAVADMFFVSDDIQVKSKRVYNLDVSDHLPISIEIDLE